MIVVKAREVERLLARCADCAATPHERAATARLLSELGDPRPGVGVGAHGTPDIAWMTVPAGVFTFQDGAPIALPAFEIARYPVTVAQYAAFATAPDGLRRQHWWHDLPLREYIPDRSAGRCANHPAGHVSWCAAIAFTRWLSARTGSAIRLPTEQEWEKAARGPHGWRYPWGDHFESGRANLNETARRDGPYFLECPVAVGLYPAGASCYGVEDLIGNVWEWCLNTFHDPDNCTLTGDAERVLRGGSWACRSDVCATTRDLDLPDFGYAGVGFRVVRVRD